VVLVNVARVDGVRRNGERWRGNRRSATPDAEFYRYIFFEIFDLRSLTDPDAEFYREIIIFEIFD
jgi:hypothetical protein